MVCRRAWLAALLALGGSAFAAEFHATTDAAVLYDAPSIKGQRLFVVGRDTPLEVIVSVEGWLKNMENCKVYEGHARFESPEEIRVGDQVISAGQIFINVGGRARVPAIPGLDQVEYLTNSSMMEVDFLPRHLVIVGGSYVGLEFGQMYRRFGSEVTILETGSRLIGREDVETSATVKEILEKEGVHVRLNVELSRVSKRGGDSR